MFNKGNSDLFGVFNDYEKLRRSIVSVVNTTWSNNLEDMPLIHKSTDGIDLMKKGKVIATFEFIFTELNKGMDHL